MIATGATARVPAGAAFNELEGTVAALDASNHR
jgi:hypothetical protein